MAAPLFIVAGRGLFEFNNGVAFLAQELVGPGGVVSFPLVSVFIKKGSLGPHVALVAVCRAGGLKSNAAGVDNPVAVVVYQVSVDLDGTGMNMHIGIIAIGAAGGFCRVPVLVHVGQIRTVAILIDAVVRNFCRARKNRFVAIVAVAPAGGDPVGIVVIAGDDCFAQIQRVDGGVEIVGPPPVSPKTFGNADAGHVERRVDHVGVVARRIFPHVKDIGGIGAAGVSSDIFPPASIKALGVDTVARRAAVQGVVIEVIVGQHVIGMPLGCRVQAGVEGQCQ